DLEGVVYISSSGWGVIVKHLQRLGGQGRRLVLSGMTPPIFKIFRDLGFEPLVQHYLSATAAVEALDIVSLEQETEASPAGSVSGDERIGSAAAGKAGGHRTESRPTIGGTSVEPLHEKPRERVEERTVELDVARKRDMREDKDQRIREIGWGEYGKRLVDRNRKPADDEDGTS
ncbi:MAG TPA: anti-sigma factor antagonist, partial [Candidatus Eisenbacteria bacterium]|nr:anti-sigma factor antagonist [Candidatus Eisenbacteria bacterium]